ncbi:unnamed protein product [Rotaria sp. Silwood1]|nr:unnamed protein product [Rotaria sp. Silwood1]
MTKSFTILTYLVLAYFNTFLLVLIILPIGIHIGRSKEIHKMNIQFNSFISNRSLIYDYINVNCPEVMIHYPIFEQFSKIQLCTNYDISMKFGKFVGILSTFYDIFLSFIFYGSSLGPVLMMFITLIKIFYMNFISDVLIIMLLETSLILVGYLMIFIHCIAPKLNQNIVNCCLKMERWFTIKIKESIDDNFHVVHDKHND